MESLQSSLAAQLQTALKNRDSVRVSTLRLAISAIRYKEVEKKRDLSDAEVLEVIRSEAKRRKESLDQYTQANRPDLAEKEKAELEILSSYLPQPMGDAELEQLVRAAIASTGATSAKDTGRVMGAVMAQIKGRADGKQAQQLVQKLLG